MRAERQKNIAYLQAELGWYIGVVYKAESSLRSVYASALAESSLVALSAKPLEEASVLVQEDTSAILRGEASAVHRKEPPGARSASGASILVRVQENQSGRMDPDSTLSLIHI